MWRVSSDLLVSSAPIFPCDPNISSASSVLIALCHSRALSFPIDLHIPGASGVSNAQSIPSNLVLSGTLSDLSDPSHHSALRVCSAPSILSNPNLCIALIASNTLSAPRALSDPSFSSAPKDPSFGSDPKVPSFGSAPQSPSFANALKASSFASAPKYPSFANTLKSPSFVSAPKSPSFASASKALNFASAPNNPSFASAP